MRFIGLDAGSVSVKYVVLDEKGTKLNSSYVRHKGHPLKVAFELLREVIGSQQLKIQDAGYRIQDNHASCIMHHASEDSELKTLNSGFSLSITGSAGRLIASVLGIEPVNELVAQAYATRKLSPHVRTIIELGGEDSKLIMLGENGVKEFSMNSVCAAGTGSFLDQQAERLRLTIEEFSELSLKSKKPPRIAGRCSVFAKSDMIHLQQIATPMEDIVAGLCFAVARNFKGSISRGRKIEMPVSFQGGVAANKGMIRAFKEVFELNDLFVPPDFNLIGALGSVLKDMDDNRINSFDIKRLEDFIKSEKSLEAGYKPLILKDDDFLERHSNSCQLSAVSHQQSEKNAECRTLNAELIPAYLGIDIGSISTNLAVIDENCNLLSKRYLMTAGQPIEAVKQGLKEIGEEAGDRVEIIGVGTTGSGRYMIADYVGADIVKNEITAQATAAAFIDRNVDTIFEIGGQDSKYISLRDGVIVDFEMNKACAAGTGSFLEEQAEKLSISVKDDFASLAFSAENPCRLGERCTVFMENSLMSNLQRGADKNNLLAGLAYSIVQNYINRVVAGKPVGENIFFQGGVAFNKSVVAAFEKYLGRKITVPPNHDVTGAIGMALIARDYMIQDTRYRIQDNRASCIVHHASTSFKGFELSKLPYSVSSFECKGCPNVCEINRIKIEGEDGHLFYGGRCEKYDVKKKKASSEIPDIFGFRDEMLWKEHEKRSAFSVQRSAKDSQLRTKIGIPYIFYFHEYLPFWTTLLWELGFDVLVSPKTNRQTVSLGLESILSETCFPVKVAYGHIKYLLNEGADALLIPSFINLNTKQESPENGFACPYTQTIPYSARVAFPNADIISPVVNLNRDKKFMLNELSKAFKPFGIKSARIKEALLIAEKAQHVFIISIREKGTEVLSAIKDKALVIIGRSYNSFDSGMNLEIPKKLAGLNVSAIPMDFLPLNDHGIDSEWPNMYWRAGQKILKAARAIRENQNLFPLYIGNFSCGPDSFILKYFKKELQGKPFLHIEIDEHSADAGAITRCEAFLDSIQSVNRLIGKSVNHSPLHPFTPSPLKKRTVYIPMMADHAFALAASFERSGVPAEVLPESDKETIDIGRKYVSGKECYPCAVTTGDMLKRVLSSDFKPAQSAFFMPSGSGPCRFGQYNVFHRMVLDDLGYAYVPIFSPNQDVEFYRDLGIVGKDFALRSWQGIIAVELLTKCLHETRPYEKENGSADFIYREYLGKICSSLKGTNGKVEVLLKSMRRDFQNLLPGCPGQEDRKPLIGIIGEIFVRSNKFSNENLARKIEAHGGEAWLAPVEEWIYYINHTASQKALLKKEWSDIMNTLLKTFFQKRVEHKYAGYFSGFLKTLKEPETREIIKKASPYLHSSFEGEAILSIGKAVDLIERGASGIVNAMPFGCMPGTIVTALMQGLNKKYGVPFISIPYDGTESPTTDIQLEAFMHQAKENLRRR
ncbi:MAG: CoA protein activase [Nitrospirae bacterium GWF2_44_13]|nr:MAG: CoA protein activase [Nitrospirae bacterium GWF2_44_13]OGW64784.1 MAG: CoA protein activase [Nitrospirae bacterium RIFOXYA2_FULL_44_9]